MRDQKHQADLCVVGGGPAGLCAAVAAARRGADVVLMHDRPVLGGNASSEIRMWICGAHGDNLRETGILEEIELENMYRNPRKNYSLWDTVLYGLARCQPNLTLLLNCSCNQLQLNDRQIVSVSGWQLTTETRHTVEAKLFADCSGDSILAPLSGAAFRLGREAASEFNESIEPEQADRKTMGMSCLLQIRQADRPQPFTPPPWAYRYDDDRQLPHRSHDIQRGTTNFWWLELGGEQDSIGDTEEIRDELLKHALGVWDHIKNHGDHGAENWTLEWLGFLPGKRESRRYEGDHILTQNDVEAGGIFDDIVAYGGWTMDDHHPAGLNHPGKPTIHHPAPSPFGIPYRCLYSRNIDNLMFAGRNISTTHAALSATRVMATCAVLGQAIGTAAALAVRHSLLPRQVYRQQIETLQQQLLDDDCFLPGRRRTIPALTAQARLTASENDPEPLRNGIDRPAGGQDNGWTGGPGAWVQYEFNSPRHLRRMRLVADSQLNRTMKNMPSRYPLDQPSEGMPDSMLKSFTVQARRPDGSWQQLVKVTDNWQRLVRLDLDATATAVRLYPESTWGAEYFHLFSWDLEPDDEGQE